MSCCRNPIPLGLMVLSSILLMLSGCGGGGSGSSNRFSLGSPAWSPDGRKVAFIGATARSDGSFSTADDELYCANIDGSGLTRLTTDTIGEDSPRWSPDGTRLALSLSGSRIFVINADGRGLTPISPVGESASSPDWSPDGQRLVYLVTDSASHTDVFVARADGTDERRVTQRDSSKYTPRWSPDGTRIAFVESGSTLPAIVVIQEDGTSAAMLPNPSLLSIAPSVTWSPDGKKIAFSAQGFRPDGQSLGLLYVSNADGTGQPSPISSSTSVQEPVWSPDGTRFLFVSSTGLASMKIDGSDVHSIPLR